MSITYLVDFENIGNRWADKLDQVSKGDTVVLFYSDNSPKAMLDQMERVERMGAVLKFRHCMTGQNGLDFQLASELGYLIGSGAGGEFRIVSEDAGYDVLSGYWRAQGVSVSRVACAGSSGVPRDQTNQMVVGVLDRPMTDMSLSRSERAHVLGCAKACMEQVRGLEDRLARFKSDTLRIRGKAMWEKLEAGLGASLADLFSMDG